MVVQVKSLLSIKKKTKQSDKILFKKLLLKFILFSYDDLSSHIGSDMFSKEGRYG